MPKLSIEIKDGDNHDNFVTIRDRNLAGTPVVGGRDQRRLNGGFSDFCDLEVDGGGQTRC